jgi:hypothetical protein
MYLAEIESFRSSQRTRPLERSESLSRCVDEQPYNGLISEKCLEKNTGNHR